MIETDNSKGVWVLGEARQDGTLARTVFELSAKARELADSLERGGCPKQSVSVVVFLDTECPTSREELQSVAGYGTDRMLVVRGEKMPFDRTLCARTLACLAKRESPRIILASATAFGRAVMPYAAALLGTGLTADCTGLSIEPETNLLLQTRPAIGGNIMATIKTPCHSPQMATTRPRTFCVPEPICGRALEIIEPDIPAELLSGGVRTLRFEPFGEADGTLQDKEAIVSGGKGLRKAEGFALLSELAALIGGGVGASRPVVEMKWIGYPHQVGLSGQVVSPKVYIAAGISGTVQHMAGMQTSGKIIAINRDPEAQIFRISDVAICGDLYEVIPLLIEKIKRRKERKGVSQ